MWYNWGKYSFTQPLKHNGKAARYLSVLSLIDSEGPMEKYEILKKVWDVKGPKEQYRGHMATTFSALHHFGVLDYNRKTYKWSLTNKGKQILEDAKVEFGKRFAEKYWN